MNTFTLYNKATGEIDKVVTTSKKKPICNKDQGFIKGFYADDVFMVVQGQAKVKPKEVLKGVPTELEIRDQRNLLLAQSDWTQASDAPVDQAAWRTYRQALRDIPSQEGFPTNVVWPTKPE